LPADLAVPIRKQAALASMRRANPILRFAATPTKDVCAFVLLIIVMLVKPSDVPGIDAKVKA
jgi:branched-subunit amino acid ABC-type transport system permease component